jgi:hypothetical protein
MKRLAAAIAFAALATNAAAVEKAPDVTPTRNSAVGYALTMDQVTRSFAGRCGSYDAAQARVARAAWTERNGEGVSSADKYLGFVRNLVTKTPGEEAARRFYEEQRAAFSRRAQLTVWDSLLAGGGEAEVCDRVLGAIAAGRMDVDPKHLRTLQEISAELARTPAR